MLSFIVLIHVLLNWGQFLVNFIYYIMNYPIVLLFLASRPKRQKKSQRTYFYASLRFIFVHIIHHLFCFVNNYFYRIFWLFENYWIVCLYFSLFHLLFAFLVQIKIIQITVTTAINKQKMGVITIYFNCWLLITAYIVIFAAEWVKTGIRKLPYFS